MNNAIYDNPTKVFFGRGMENLIGQQVNQYADRVLLHYGGGSAEKSGLLARIRLSLEDAGVQYYELGGVKPNPRLNLVYEGIKICRDNGIGFVVAVGGGSVIDSAKAIACGTPNSEDVWEYFTTDKHAKTVLPVATVLTIPGAGSESSNGMVITNEQTKQKLAYESSKARPLLSFLNPELTYTVPKYHTAAGIADAMAHVMERYFTHTKNVDVTDRLCEGVMRSLIKYGRQALDQPENYDVRAEIMWACKMAHDGTLGVGREEDWASHMIEHELSAQYDISHGAGLAVLFPAWIQYVYENDIDRFMQFAMRVFDVEYDAQHPSEAILQGVARLKAFFASLDMPTSMQQLCPMKKEDARTLAQNVFDENGGPVGNMVKLDVEDIKNIYELSFE